MNENIFRLKHRPNLKRNLFNFGVIRKLIIILNNIHQISSAMANFTRIEVALKMGETGMVPVFDHTDADICKQVLKACYEGGVRVFEFTNRNDFAVSVFSELKNYALANLPGLMLGAGTVMDGYTAALFIDKGADFIVSPVFNPEIAKTCNRRKILWIPGCGSVTEIGDAEEMGAEIVKIFPAKQVGGPDYIASIKPAMKHSCIMPTGGVDTSEENLGKWFKAGAYCVGMGSKLIPVEIIEKKDFASLTNKVRETLAIIKKLRQHD